MSIQLYLDTEAANAVVHEMKSYQADIISSTMKNIIEIRASMSDTRTWVAAAFNDFDNTLGFDILTIFQEQISSLENLISRLEKEIREWEETSQRLGS